MPHSLLIYFRPSNPLVKLNLFLFAFHPPTSEESMFLAFRQSLCDMVFSALLETNSSLQITATSMLTSLAQQTGETRYIPPVTVYSLSEITSDILSLSGLLLDSDIELAVDHLTRLLLTEEDEKVRWAHGWNFHLTLLFSVNHLIRVLLSLSFNTHRLFLRSRPYYVKCLEIIYIMIWRYTN